MAGKKRAAPTPSGGGDLSTGWLRRRCKRGLEPAWRKTCSIDFIIENPDASKMWGLRAIDEIVGMSRETPSDRNADALVKLFRTSYCHYGGSARKKTKFLTTLMQARIKPQCSKETPCAQKRTHGRHSTTIEDASAEDKNAIPAPLIDAFFDAWLNKARACRYGPRELPPDRFLVIDAFTGYGSVTARAMARNLDVRSNDIIRQGPRRGVYNEDLSKTTLKELLIFAIGAVYGADALSDSDKLPFDEMLSKHGIAVLFWLSPPCCTYSTSSGNTHRDARSLTPKTPLAANHDAMNKKLARELVQLALTPPSR